MLKKIKKILLSFRLFKLLIKIKNVLSSHPSKFKKIKFLIDYFKDWGKYKALEMNNVFESEQMVFKPAIFDKTEITNIDPIYFFQDAWCARKIFEKKPQKHVDIGSKIDLVSIISQFTPTTFVDIRPIDLKLKNLEFKKDDILNLSFKDNSIQSLSSICVIEHIGLGRYGNKLDSFGSEKAAQELKRILAESGDLYVSLPIDVTNKIYFNAHRAFTRNYVLEMFAPLKLIEEKYIYGNSMFNYYDPQKGFGTGLYYFKK